MGKSMLSMHREIEKEAYFKTPLGKIEKELGRIYKDLQAKGQKLPEDVSKKVFDIRDANEKAQTDYIDRTNREHKIAVDKMLFDSMSKELKIIKKALNL